jgi:predicted nucleotidyltransferase
VTVATTLYRAIATFAAARLARMPAVEGVYTRRSLACGEVTLGRSDIDLTILITPAAGLGDEAEALRRLARRFAVLRRVITALGTCEIGTRAELDEWYRSPWFPASSFRDRGWLRLVGAPFTPPAPPLGEAEREQLLRWLFWAWETLPRFHREGNTRTCVNLLLDMVNVHDVYVGALERPATRADLLARWRPRAPRLPAAALAAALRGRAGREGRSLRRAVYRESLALCEALFAAVPLRLEGRIEARELRTLTPFGFAPRRYLLVDPSHETEVEEALAVMERDPSAHLTTKRALRLYWWHRNPWEYFTRGAEAVRRTLAPPPRPALLAAVRYHLHRIVPRRLGLSIGRRVDGSAAIGPRYAQGRLWLEHGIVAGDADELARRYREAYGAWPYAAPADRDTYFLERYPLLCGEIESIARHAACA